MESHNLTPPRFNIGVHVPRVRAAVRRAPPQNYIPPQNITPINLFAKPWLLIPAPEFHMEYILLRAGNTIVEVMQCLCEELRKQMKPTYLSFTHHTPESRMKLMMDCINFAKKNQKMRVAFRALLLRWLSKRIRPGNEEDLMTGEVPQKLVTLMAWSERREYAFEASTILRDMTERLLQHSYFFTKFSKPRNPYTNVELTQGQFFSIMKQLKAVGVTNWIVEALYNVKYDMEAFKKQYGMAVKVEIINRQFKNTNATETKDSIHDFIDDQHDDNGFRFNSSLYQWALANAQHLPRMKEWISLCKEYYMAIATISEKIPLGEKLIQIKNATMRLCSVPRDLSLYRARMFKKNLLAERGTVEDETENLIVGEDEFEVQAEAAADVEVEEEVPVAQAEVESESEAAPVAEAAPMSVNEYRSGYFREPMRNMEEIQARIREYMSGYVLNADLSRYENINIITPNTEPSDVSPPSDSTQ